MGRMRHEVKGTRLCRRHAGADVCDYHLCRDAAGSSEAGNGSYRLLSAGCACLRDRLERVASRLVDLPTSRRDQQVGHQDKARPPDHRHPKDNNFRRAHARPRHDQ